MTAKIIQCVRPYVTVLFTTTVCWGFYADRINSDAFLGIVGVVIIYWFKSRDEDKERASVAKEKMG